ncbi:protein DMR6-LIKE OXYGENASE 1-like [Macadamia integrifolia]|uniref:protein DMR6-LIKE OXYGENASE 1-like n=1 Tax=Macadamia integrifolia TaxID=60698 RepID=UPI001C533213|nr:protein DMR6-LIKE OXYGENASE 1-like [Macadamia integrifolia]
MGEVDATFIQAIEHRPKFITGLEAEGIPLIDLSLLNSYSLEGYSKDHSQAISDLVEEIGRSACKDWGFFQVINHGVPSVVRKRIETVGKKFFDLPIEEKRKVRRDEMNPLGYYDSEHTKNVRDWKEVFDFTVVDPTVIPLTHEPDDQRLRQITNQWPDYPPDLRDACEEYCRAVERLGFKLLEVIALSLGLPAKRFNEFFKDQTSSVRINHYPPCPSPELALGVGQHKDVGALTVLAQDDVGGLEVKRKTDGEWVMVKPIPDSYIINVGDIIQVWSNDRYESVEHRVVVNSERERFSIPFVLNPSHYVMIKPLEELVDKEKEAPKYKEYNLGKFFSARRLTIKCLVEILRSMGDWMNKQLRFTDPRSPMKIEAAENITQTGTLPMVVNIFETSFTASFAEDPSSQVTRSKRSELEIGDSHEAPPQRSQL